MLINATTLRDLIDEFPNSDRRDPGPVEPMTNEQLEVEIARVARQIYQGVLRREIRAENGVASPCHDIDVAQRILVEQFRDLLRRQGDFGLANRSLWG